MKSVKGSLWKGKNRGCVIPSRGASAEKQDGCVTERVPEADDRLSFAGVYLFTLLLHVRPNDLFPALFGTFPIAKIVVMATAFVYIASRLNTGRTLLRDSVELKMVALIAVLAVLFMPVAASKQDTIDTLLEGFLKILIIFALIINVVNSRRRLDSLLKLVLICNLAFGVDAIRSFAAGEVDKYSRIKGALVGGVFGNPNDLATSLDMLLPLAVAFALNSKGLSRFTYFTGAVLIATAVVLTFSRAGFLGLVVPGGFLLWKLSRRHRFLPVAAVLVFGVGLLIILPTGYGNRLATILSPNTDDTGSAQLRQLVLQRGMTLAVRHAVVGIGMGNFHIFSVHELRAHNSFIEIAAELGWAGLLAYIVLIGVPLCSLRRIERETLNAESPFTRENHCLAIALQASLVSYLINSSFGSYQYSWFPYYGVAYAIALRTIHSLRQQAESLEPAFIGSAGVLWSRSKKGWIRPFAPVRRAAIHILSRESAPGLEKSV